MAAAPIPAPPGGGGGAPPAAAQVASPAPAQPNPQKNQASQGIITVVQILRGISQSFPSTVPLVAQANNLVRDIQLEIMRDMGPGEAAAPPTPPA